MTAKQWNGAYTAVVALNNDPTGRFRVKLKIPQVLGTAVSQWALPVGYLSAVPPIGAVVTTMFLGGDVNHPIFLTTPASLPTSSSIYIAPSGDTTGVADPAAVMAAFNIGVKTVLLTSGEYYGKPNIVVLNEGNYCNGMGRYSTIWNVVNGSAGPAFRFKPANTSTYSQTGCGGIGYMTIDCTSAVSGTIAVQPGDIVHLSFPQLGIRNCTTAPGFYVLNSYFWTEQLQGELWLENCNPHVKFDVSSSNTPTGSFDRMNLDIDINQGTASYDGVVFVNGASTVHHNLSIRGNFKSTTSAVTSCVLRVGEASPNDKTPTNASVSSYCGILGGNLNIGVEMDSSGGSFAPSSILFGSSNCLVDQNTGTINFNGYGSGSFAASNNNGNFSHIGEVLGDNALVTKLSGSDYVTYSATPSGWSGSVSCIKTGDHDLVYLECSLNVPSGSVISAGTVLAGLAAPHQPSVNKVITLGVYDSSTGDVTVIPVTVSATTGHLSCSNGTSITLGGSGSVLGTAVYANSH